MLYETDNVTMNGSAAFWFDGHVMKTAYLTWIQAGTHTMCDWQVESEEGIAGATLRGYTTVTIPQTGLDEDDDDEWGVVYAMESYNGGRTMHYYLDSDMLHLSILRHTVSLDTLLRMGDAVFALQPDFGHSAIIEEDGMRTITLSLTEKDVPEAAQSLLNLLAQYGARRYTGDDLDKRSIRSDA